MGVQLTAVKAFPYAGRRLRPNDDFDASAADARILTALGKAKPRVSDEGVSKRKYKRRDLVAE